MTRFRRRRLQIALIVIGCLLFQQIALAAYACTLIQVPPAPIAMASSCAEMGMAHAKPSLALCEKHCAPDHSVTPDGSPLSVPALALPPIAFALAFNDTVSKSTTAADVPIARSDPPPRLRYCSLLI